MSELKVGDKVKMNAGLLKGLAMGDMVGQRWTVKKLDPQGRPTVEMDNDNVELSLGPLPLRAVDAWTEDDERALEALPPLF